MLWSRRKPGKNPSTDLFGIEKASLAIAATAILIHTQQLSKKSGDPGNPQIRDRFAGRDGAGFLSIMGEIDILVRRAAPKEGSTKRNFFCAPGMKIESTGTD